MSAITLVFVASWLLPRFLKVGIYTMPEFYRSRDGGRTWGDPEILFTAGHDRNTGCWEPAAIELASGRGAAAVAFPRSGALHR